MTDAGSPIARSLNLELTPSLFRERLDAAESLTPGSGLLELRAFALPGSAGIAVDYSHRLNENLSAFGAGYAGARYGQGRLEPDFGAMAGLRLRF